MLYFLRKFSEYRAKNGFQIGIPRFLSFLSEMAAWADFHASESFMSCTQTEKFYIQQNGNCFDTAWKDRGFYIEIRKLGRNCTRFY